MISYRKYAIISGLLIGIMNTLGYIAKYYKVWEFGIVESLMLLGSVSGTVIVAGLCFRLLDWGKSKKLKKICDLFPNKKFYIVIMLCLIVLLLIPVYMSLYPGLVNYDAPYQLYQYTNRCITEHHPVIHTFLFGAIFSGAYEATGNILAAVAIYYLFQSAVFILLIIWIFLFFYDENVSIVTWILGIFFYLIFPPITIHWICVTKDNYFSLFLVCFIIINYKLFSKGNAFFENKINIALWIVFALGTIIFRNNAFYSMLVFAPIWMLCAKKVIINRNKYMPMLILFISIFLIYKLVFVRTITVAGVDKREMLSIPAQQLARVLYYHSDELNEEQLDVYNNLFSKGDIASNYEPLIADVAKAAIDVEYLDAHKNKCIRMYMSLLKEYPKDFCFSVLKNTYGYWYMWPKLILTSEGDYGYVFLESFDPFWIETKNHFFYKLYDSFFNGNITNDNTAISMVFFPGMYIYFFIILFFYCVEQTYKIASSLLLFIFAVWGTFLLGPVVLVRYVLFLFLLMPVSIVFLYRKCGWINE